MSRFARAAICAVVGVVSIMVLAGCGVDPKRLDAAEARIKALIEKGAPESKLFEQKVMLVEIRGLMKANDIVNAGAKADSLDAALVAAEAWYTEAIAKMGPEIEAVKKTLGEQKAGLTGLQLRVADSIIAKADEQVAKTFLLQARDILTKLEEQMPVLLDDEKKASTLKPKVTGTWKQSVNPDGVGTSSLLKSVFTFKKDGTFESTEEKKGQSDERTKEDWKFVSGGTWQMKGDTVAMHVTREKCERQNFEFLKVKDGKETWEKKQEPTYDSTFTDNHKDKTMTWKDLSSEYKK